MVAVAKVRCDAPNAARTEATTGLMADAAGIESRGDGGEIEGRMSGEKARA